MKPSKLYSNKPDIFAPVEFTPELNVVLAEIRLPENRDRDTHNLGKTTLGRLLDFGSLANRDPKFFLFKHIDVFGKFVFFLEIELAQGSYVTVRRSVEEATKIAFKKHAARHQDFTTLPDSEWDHVEVPFDRAKELLDSILDWRSLNPWHFRKGLGYFLRSQSDFGDVFQLGKFANKHADWKPFLAHILGFDAAIIARHYTKAEELEDKQAKAATIRQEMGGHVHIWTCEHVLCGRWLRARSRNPGTFPGQAAGSLASIEPPRSPRFCRRCFVSRRVPAP